MPPYHVLVADDDVTVVSLIARILTRTYPSLRVWPVRDGMQALALYDQQQIDFLITDYDMPSVDGLTLVATLRQTRRATIPILMVSANMAIEPHARALGATAFLLKPFSIAQLTAIVTTLLPP